MIHFSRYNKLYLLISLLVIGSGLVSVVRYGYRVAIDFTGGSQLAYQVTAPDAVNYTDTLQQAAQTVGATYIEHSLSADDIVHMRLAQFDDQKEPQFREALQKKLNGKIQLISQETVGPTIGADAIRKTLIAAAIGIVIILGYILYAFKRFTFAIAAIVALVHDVLVVLGTYSLISYFFGAQLDTLFVTALLTTMSFSTHDTIVIFDNIRDAMKRGVGTHDIAYLADKAVSATMVRSLNNSLTIIFMLLALVLLGGSTIKFFAIALLIGTVTGVYSSPFVATPVMVWLEKRRLARG